MRRRWFMTFIFFWCLFTSRAEVSLPDIFSDNMILQRNANVNIWGWADSLEKITVTLKDKKYQTIASKDGKWLVTIGKHGIGDPFSITVKGKNEIILNNVQFGDVWVCSGQSNMEWPLINDLNGQKAVSESYDMNLRLFKVEKQSSLSPKENLKGMWKVCNPSSSATFSAVAYYFGKEIIVDQDIPVGLIEAAWGGSSIQTWISANSLSDTEMFSEKIADIQSSEDYLHQRSKQFETELGEWCNYLARQSRVWETEKEISTANVDPASWTDVKLPISWERTSVGDFDGLVWYKTEFEGKRFLSDSITAVSLGKLSDHDVVFLNGKMIGSAGWKEWERFYQIPDSLLMAGMNELVVGIINYGGSGGFLGQKNDLFFDSFDQSLVNVRYPISSDWKFLAEPVHLQLRPTWLGAIYEPTLLYNSMIHPLVSNPITGVLWYQGEQSKVNPSGYDVLLKTLIEDWRLHWSQPDLPFFFVQLPNYENEPGMYPEDNWPVLRSLQARVLEVPNTGMVVTYDIGDPFDIHPLQKQQVGHRLALLALKKVYGQDVICEGPKLESVSKDKDGLSLVFDQLIMAADDYGYVKGFEVGMDSQDGLRWVKVQAKINKKIIRLESPFIQKPITVRYAWRDNPDANVCGETGLPANPFLINLDNTQNASK